MLRALWFFLARTVRALCAHCEKLRFSSHEAILGCENTGFPHRCGAMAMGRLSACRIDLPRASFQSPTRSIGGARDRNLVLGLFCGCARTLCQRWLGRGARTRLMRTRWLRQTVHAWALAQLGQHAAEAAMLGCIPRRCAEGQSNSPQDTAVSSCRGAPTDVFLHILQDLLCRSSS